jgi:hypothetical protein
MDQREGMQHQLNEDALNGEIDHFYANRQSRNANFILYDFTRNLFHVEECRRLQRIFPHYHLVSKIAALSLRIRPLE